MHKARCDPRICCQIALDLLAEDERPLGKALRREVEAEMMRRRDWHRPTAALLTYDLGGCRQHETTLAKLLAQEWRHCSAERSC